MTTRTLLTPVSITATGRGPDLDVSGLSGEAAVILTARNTAGTAPTLACKLQSSPGVANGYTQAVVGATDNELLSASTTANALAATFEQVGDRSIKRVFLMLKKNGTIAAGKLLTVKIKDDDTGDPDAVLGTSGTVSIDDVVGTAYALIAFEFATPVDVSDEGIYHIELTGDYTAHADNNVTWRSVTVADDGNFVQLDDTTWTATATKDLECRVEQYEFTDITGGEFTEIETALNTAVETLQFHARSLPRYMSLHSTIGGTSNPAFAVAAVVQANRVQED